ncbi:MAG: AAA family ATPase [Terracidiphilus sp.]|nr:AAA family ATPase [Terracidiphilus sp.]
MKIEKLSIRNYRTLQNVEIAFPSYYCAICGKNNSGKTNLIRVLRQFLRDTTTYYYMFPFEEKPRLSIKEDFPAWIQKDGASRSIQIDVCLDIHKISDEGLYQFLVDYLDVETPTEVLKLHLSISLTEGNSEPVVSASIDDKPVDQRKAKEVLQKIQSSPTALFHNSTDPEGFGQGASRAGSLRELDCPEIEDLDKSKNRLNNVLAKIAKRQQRGLGDLLGRLTERYKVGFSISEFDLDNFPYKLTLGDGGMNIPIENWGSGTQNQTQILMALFRAKQISERESAPSKITPVIVIEEPESFLHPSAQGEFGHLLQSLAEEFKVQVIVTTHSHYMLSTGSPECNVLLERKHVEKGRVHETYQVDTSGKLWMEPFAQALGLNNEHFSPWKDAFFSSAEKILLVEGETDKEYLKLLQSPEHKDNRLKFDGFIFPYNGKDQVNNRALLGLLKSRYKKFFITYDLDVDKELSKVFEEVGLQRGKHFLAVGQTAPGKQAIEGLIPDSIHSAVYGANVELVQQLASASPEHKKSAKSRLKRMLLDEFKRVAVPGEEYYGRFYGLAKKIDNAMS